MSAVDDLIKTRSAGSAAPITTAAPSGGSAVDTLISARKSAAAPAASANIFAPIGNAARTVATGVGNALDAQRFGVAKLLTGKDNTDDQRTAERQAVGTQGIYDAIGHIPVIGHALQGASDVVQDTVTDPLTYETLGAGPILKATGLAAKAAPAIEAATKAVTSTPAGALLHDTLNWGGEVTRNLGKGTTNTIRGALNKASTTGAQTAAEYKRLSQGIIDGLSDEEKMNVRRGLNGELGRPKSDLRRVESDADPKVYNSEWLQSVGREGPVKRYDYYRGDTKVGSVEVGFPTKSGTPHIEDLETKVLFRNQGVAQSMLHDVSDHLHSQGYKEATMTPTNDAAQAVNKRVFGEPVKENSDINAPFSGVSDLHSLDPSRATLTSKEQAAVTGLRQLTERDYADRTKTMLAKKFNDVAYRLTPDNRTALATALRTSTRPAGELGDVYDSLLHQTREAMPHRENYAPTAHQAPAAGDAGHAATPRTAGETFDTRNLQRENVPTTEPGQLHEGFDALATNAGRQAADRVIHESLGDLVNDPAVKKLITDAGKATGEKRTDIQKVGDAWLKVIGYPRAATVSLTPRHAANIIDLAANTVPPAQFPAYMKNVMSDAAKLVKASPEEHAAYVKDSAAVSQDFNEHQPFFQNVPGLNKWTAANNKLVWAVDTAAKVNYEKLLKKAHPEMSDLEAGGTASERLIDYANRSPATQALRYIAPFGTFRGSVPGAVAGGVARNPARAALLNRISQGTLYGGRPGKGQGGGEFYGPTADVARGIDSPGEFLRGTLGAPVQAVGTLAGEMLTGNPAASIQQTGQEIARIPGQVVNRDFSHIGTPPKVSPYARAVQLRTSRFLNYGNPIDLRWLANAALAGVPEAGTALEQVGGSQFNVPKGTPIERLAREVLRQTSGITVK